MVLSRKRKVDFVEPEAKRRRAGSIVQEEEDIVVDGDYLRCFEMDSSDDEEMEVIGSFDEDARIQQLADEIDDEESASDRDEANTPPSESSFFSLSSLVLSSDLGSLADFFYSQLLHRFGSVRSPRTPSPPPGKTPRPTKRSTISLVKRRRCSASEPDSLPMSKLKPLPKTSSGCCETPCRDPNFYPSKFLFPPLPSLSRPFHLCFVVVADERLAECISMIR